MADIRVTCLNCMDGRVQLPVHHWILEHRKVDFIDVITEAGMDGVLADPDHDISEILYSIEISVKRNYSTGLFVVGHYDCRGNPNDEKTHHEHIVKAIERVKYHWKTHSVTGLWVNSNWQVEEVKTIA
jgi:hypothetical protein